MKLTRSKRLAATGVAVVALAGGGLIAGTSPANAAVPSCGTVNPATATGVHTARTAYSTHNGRTLKVELRYGTLSGHQYGWTRISNANGGRLVKSDAAVIDVTNDGGRTFRGCWTFAKGGETNVWTNAVRTSSSSLVRFRAFGGIYDSAKHSWFGARTSWW